MPRTPRGAPVQRLAHLPDTGRLHRARRAGQLEELRIPLQAWRGKQRARARLGGADEAIIVEVDDVRREEPLPVSHQAAVLAVEVARVHEVERVTHALVQMQEVHRQAIVERIVRRVHDQSVG